MDACVIAALGFPAMLVVLFVAGHLSGFKLGRHRYKNLEHLAREVSSVVGLEAHLDDAHSAWFPLLRKLRFEGVLEGRNALVLFYEVSHGSTTTTWVRLWLRAQDLVPLKVTREGWFEKIGKAFGAITELEIGRPEFDAKYLLVSPDEPRAADALRKGAADAIDRVFGFWVAEVELEAQSLEARAPADRIDPNDYAEIFRPLARAAECGERVAVRVRALGSTPRKALRSDGETRCVYCREAITGDEPDLVACKRCSTVVHEACWTEHGRCSVFGCSGRERERGR